MVTFTKERYAPDSTRILGYQGICRGKETIIIDDIISTGGTAIHAAEKAIELGSTAVHGYFVHPVLPGLALERIEGSIFSKVFVTNSLPLPARPKDFTLGSKVKILDISGVIAQSITSF